MQQLLRITSTPIKYELQIQHAKLEATHEYIPHCSMRTVPSHLQIQRKETQICMDSYEMRKSLGLQNNMDFAGSTAQYGRQSIQKVTRGYVDMGNAMSEIQTGVSIGDIIAQKMQEQPGMYTAVLPSAGTNISWIPGSCKVNFTRGSFSCEWAEHKNSANYIPASVHIHILEYPKVNIEYIGKPQYVPPRDSPDYVKDFAKV